MSKLKPFTDDKMNVAQKMISVFDRVENIVGKGENAGYQHVLLLPQCFQKPSFFRVVKTLDSLPNNIILGKSKLEAFSDHKIRLTQNLKLVL